MLYAEQLCGGRCGGSRSESEEPGAGVGVTMGVSGEGVSGGKLVDAVDWGVAGCCVCVWL